MIEKCPACGNGGIDRYFITGIYHDSNSPTARKTETTGNAPGMGDMFRPMVMIVCPHCRQAFLAGPNTTDPQKMYSVPYQDALCSTRYAD